MRNHSFFFFILFLSFSSSTTSLSSTNFLSKGSSLSVEQASYHRLTSPNQTFTCGFYNIDGTNAYWFSIWFTHSKDQTVIWTANRDKPINGRGSKLALRNDGAMVLTDLGGLIAWETNTTSAIVDRAELLESGNLVLVSPKGKVLWQSFDFPTDTLVPNQLFTKSKGLVSSIGLQNFGSGYFSFYFDSDNVLKLIYDGPEISSLYWPNVDLTVYQNGRTNYNSSRIASLDDMGKFLSSDQLQFSASDYGDPRVKRRLTMDYDGNLRLYSLNDSSGLWVITWEAISQLCNVHGLCGRNGVCVYAPDTKCSCPPHHEQVNLTDFSKGCKPKFKRSCSDSEFLELTHTDFYGFDLNFSQTLSFEDCRQLCLGDCRCQAFSYRLTGQGLCYTKSALFNGYRSIDFPGDIYIRIPKMMQTLKTEPLNMSDLACGVEARTVMLPGSYVNINQRFKWVYLYSFVSAIGAFEILVLALGWWFLVTKHGMPSALEDGYRAISSQFSCFSYATLRKATGGFKEILGRGGFGVVYKGVLADEGEVAVKRLGDVFQGEEEFWAEVSTIGRINHMNLARMWGFCSEKKHRLLVYEYVQNRSLDKHLFSTTAAPLGWKERFKIALGAAKGLAYLHHECLEWVIHCDLKPENILLDADFEPKISDFGLAKLAQRGGSGSSEMSRIRGTKGYMAPEWAMNLPITAKIDVYSYGVVVLELVKGIRLSNLVVDGSDHEQVSELARFVRMAKMKMQGGEDFWVEDLVDTRLKGEFNRKQAAMMIEVGLSCVEEDRNKRPTMESVAHILTEYEDSEPLPRF